MTKVQQLAIDQLKEALRLIEADEVDVSRVNVGFYDGKVTDISIKLDEK